MRIDVVTLFPELVEGVGAFGITARALRKGLLGLHAWNPRDYTDDRHRTVDDRPYGGGPGMVMMVEPLRRCIRAVRAQAGPEALTIYLSPQGRRLEQRMLVDLAGQRGVILVAGRYEGVDERLVAAEVDEEWSIGDYVLSGGELPAMVVIDGLTRLLPGALGGEGSAEQESFMDGLLDYPHYTRPADSAGQKVPEVLLSGDHAAIRRWRLREALFRTRARRPDLLERRELTEEEAELLHASGPQGEGRGRKG